MVQKPAAVWLAVFLVQLPLLVFYCVQLLSAPAYRWLPVLVGAGMWWLIGTRWNRTLTLPQGWIGLALTLGGVGIALVAVLFNLAWLSAWGLFLSSGGFLHAHRDRDGRGLLILWPVLAAMLTPPLAASPWLSALVIKQVTSTGSDLLRFLRVAHIPYESAIGLLGHRIYPEQSLGGFASWPIFIALALLHSTAYRRHWVVTVFNLATALASCFAFHVGVLITTAYLTGRSPQQLSLLASAMTQLGWFALCWLLFLSAERGARCALAPITDGGEDGPVANPLVVGWNRVFARKQAVPNSAHTLAS